MTETGVAAPPTSIAKNPQGRSRKWGVRIAKILVCVYLGLAIILYFAQTWLIFPGHGSQGKQWASMAALKDTGLVHLTTHGGEKIVALFGPAIGEQGKRRADAASRPTVIFFYGNASSLAFVLGQFRGLREAGANVIIPEFVGFGMSEGSPSEQGCYDTADATYDYLLTRADVDHDHSVAAGWSLGAAPAIDLASRRPIAGLMTFSAFTSLTDMGRKMFPIFPTTLLLKYRFDNQHKLAGLTCPILLCHGRHDTIVPFAMSDALARVVKSPLTRVNFESDHNDIFDVGGEELWTNVKQFLDSTARDKQR